MSEQHVRAIYVLSTRGWRFEYFDNMYSITKHSPARHYILNDKTSFRLAVL